MVVSETELLSESPAAEYSSMFFTVCHECQWHTGLLSPLFPTPFFFFCGWMLGTKLCKGFLSFFAQISLLVAAAASPIPVPGCLWLRRLIALAPLTCFHHQTYTAISRALKKLGFYSLLKLLPPKCNLILFFPSPSRSARGCYWRRGWRAWCY